MNTYFTWPCHETQWQIFSESTRTDERVTKNTLLPCVIWVTKNTLLPCVIPATHRCACCCSSIIFTSSVGMQIQIKSKSQMGWILPHSGGMIYKEIDNRMHSRCRRELPPQLGWILPHWIGILSRLSVGGSRLWLAPGFSWEELWFLVVLDQASPPSAPAEQLLLSSRL